MDSKDAKPELSRFFTTEETQGKQKRIGFGVQFSDKLLEQRLGPDLAAKIKARKLGIGASVKKNYITPKGYVEMGDKGFFADSPLLQNQVGRPAGNASSTVFDEAEQLHTAEPLAEFGIYSDKGLLEGGFATKAEAEARLDQADYFDEKNVQVRESLLIPPPSRYSERPPLDIHENIVGISHLQLASMGNLANSPNMKASIFQEHGAGPGREINSWRWYFTLAAVASVIADTKWAIQCLIDWTYVTWYLAWKGAPGRPGLKQLLFRSSLVLNFKLLRRMGLGAYGRYLKVKYVRPAPRREVTWLAAEPLKQPDGSYLACPNTDSRWLILADGAYTLEEYLRENERQGVPMSKVLGAWMRHRSDMGWLYQSLNCCDHCDGRGTKKVTDTLGYVDPQWYEGELTDSRLEQLKADRVVAAAARAKTLAEVRADPKFVQIDRTELSNRWQGTSFELTFSCGYCNTTGVKPDGPTWSDASQLAAFRLGLTNELNLSDNFMKMAAPATIEGIKAAFTHGYTNMNRLPNGLLKVNL